MSISQEEAIRLFQMKKLPVKSIAFVYPHEGEKIEIELQSQDKRFSFSADINRSGNKAKKFILQNRTNKVYILRRLDFIGSPHRNPPEEIEDEFLSQYAGKEIQCPHLHIYQEGFNDKWAIPLSDVIDFKINNEDDLYEIMKKFFNYCNIDQLKFQPLGLFQ